MAGVRFADVRSRPAEFLNLTSLTLEEFQALVAPFEAAFQEDMAAWRLDGKPRTARRFRVSRTCPLATPQDREHVPGRPEEFHLQPPTEPCVNLSIYTARPSHSPAILR
jgi:hypothetical protein